jgi:hypothetical protein
MASRPGWPHSGHSILARGADPPLRTFYVGDPSKTPYTRGATTSPVGRIHTRSTAAYGLPILMVDGYAPTARCATLKKLSM